MIKVFILALLPFAVLGGYGRKGGYGGDVRIDCRDVAETIYTSQCNTVYEQECRTVQETKYRTEYKQECRTQNRQQCHPVSKSVPRQHCSTTYTKVCSGGGKKGGGYGHHGRRRRSAEPEPLFGLLKKLFGKKKGRDGHQRKRCHSVPQQHCQTTYEHVTQNVCRSVPGGQQCRKVPRQVPYTVPSHSCQKVPRQQCRQVPQTVTRQDCSGGGGHRRGGYGR